MKPYTKTYLKYFGYKIPEDVLCEVCGSPAVDIYHLTPRSLRKDLINKIDNLMALCRTCHDRAGQDREFNEGLRYIHRKKLLKNGLPDNERVILSSNEGRTYVPKDTVTQVDLKFIDAN